MADELKRRLTAEPGTLDKMTAMQALAYLGRELGPEWDDQLKYAELLLITYTVHLHQILYDIEALEDLSDDGQLIVIALLGYADRHRSATLRGIARFFLDNFDVDEERL